MRLPEDVVQVVTAGGLLHDIGKMLMPPDLLNKKAPLTEYEERVMRDHVTKGYDLVKDEDIDQRIKNCILMHHEFKDGSGYPLHLSGDKIDEVVSIITVSNIYDEMTSRRTYSLSEEMVTQMFSKQSGDGKDPEEGYYGFGVWIIDNPKGQDYVYMQGCDDGISAISEYNRIAKDFT